jgi:hypothetical protein
MAMTPQEVMAVANSTRHGMSEEENRRRDVLIQGLLQSNPDLAYQVAKGPYRMNGTQSPQGPSVSDRTRGNPATILNGPPINRPASQQPQQPPRNVPQLGNASAPPAGSTAPVNVNINLGGQPQQGPMTQAQATAQGYQAPATAPSWVDQPSSSTSANFNWTDPTKTQGNVPYFDPLLAAQSYGGAAVSNPANPGQQQTFMPTFGTTPGADPQASPQSNVTPQQYLEYLQWALSGGSPPPPITQDIAQQPANSNLSGVIPGGALGAMSNKFYPYSSNYLRPDMIP